MPYIHSTLRGDLAQRGAALAHPYGPGFGPEIAEHTAELVITRSGPDDPGEPWTRYSAYDQADQLLATRRVDDQGRELTDQAQAE